MDYVHWIRGVPYINCVCCYGQSCALLKCSNDHSRVGCKVIMCKFAMKCVNKLVQWKHFMSLHCLITIESILPLILPLVWSIPTSLHNTHSFFLGQVPMYQLDNSMPCLYLCSHFSSTFQVENCISRVFILLCMGVFKPGMPAHLVS